MGSHGTSWTFVGNAGMPIIPRPFPNTLQFTNITELVYEWCGDNWHSKCVILHIHSMHGIEEEHSILSSLFYYVLLVLYF